MAGVTMVVADGRGVEVEVVVVVAAGVDATGIWTVEVKPAVAVDTGVRVAALWVSSGVGKYVPEQAANIAAHSSASPADQVMLA